MIEISDLRRKVFTELLESGFDISDGVPELPEGEGKEVFRKLHERHRQLVLKDQAEFIWNKEDALLHNFADGAEIDLVNFSAEVREVATSEDEDLFKYASLTWSVPVTVGYGRRTKFLVRDRANGKLVGIFALMDPVINLTPRDSEIGWNKENKSKRLYNVMDAFVLGAVDPYRQLIAGKLIALAVVSNEVRQRIFDKYQGTTTVIQGVKKDPTPVLFTTTSALGKSSIYNRISFGERKIFRPVGYTQGFGHFHFSNELFDDLRDFVSDDERFRTGAFAQGPNYRIRTIRLALDRLGLNPNILKHGIKREVYIAPLGYEWKAYLCCQTEKFTPFDFPIEEISEFWRKRWAANRAINRPEHRSWSKEDLRLTRSTGHLLKQPRLL